MNDDVQRIWDGNAEWRDDYVGPEGNRFHRELVAPAQMRLLDLRPGERVIEIACGNGHFAREMARAGARVIATDFAEKFLERARAHTAAAGLDVEYRLADATDESQLLALGDPASFDAAVCTMAVHDIETLAPMMRAVRTLLRDGARFVFSVTHPCFNHSGVAFVTETEDVDGDLQTAYAIKMQAYLDQPPSRGIGIVGQPAPHWYFNRSLSELLRPAFEAGFTLDGMEEPAFPPSAEPTHRPSSWNNYPQIPPVLVVRLLGR